MSRTITDKIVFNLLYRLTSLNSSNLFIKLISELLSTQTITTLLLSKNFVLKITYLLNDDLIS